MSTGANTLFALRLRCSSAVLFVLLPSWSESQKRSNHGAALQLLSSSASNKHNNTIFATALGKFSQHFVLFPSGRVTHAESFSPFKGEAFKGGPAESYLEAAERKPRYRKKVLVAEDDSGPLPQGPRWAVAHPQVDFSGTWKPIMSKEFEKEHELYLYRCGTTVLFRKLIIKFSTLTREIITQEDQGRHLHLHTKTPIGIWKRTLVASGADEDSSDFEPYHTSFVDPDKERVHVEAWWEQNGTVHKSWLRGKKKVDGGSFESTRYIETCETTGEDILVCESRFHPSETHRKDPNSRFQPAFVRWKYQREL